MDVKIISKLHKDFESHIHKEGELEYWLARDLQILLGYDRWENFQNAVVKAKISCGKAKQQLFDHFREVTKMILLGKGAKKSVDDIMLTRYACYLIAQNGDPKMKTLEKGKLLA